MWESLKEQIIEVGSAALTGADASAYVKDNAVVFVYEGNKLQIPITETSDITLRHIGGGTVMLKYKFIEVLGKIEIPE
ncbi:MAG TPA: hypothetical protein O0X21_03060 [Methanocorpusculum sp.]|jgi:hypothetical protein|nr:hypothetical protein [Methanocorpusculum sp.]MEE1135756.1 hypothetical protein [Methanocorpusculum sp.]HJJ61651.1 hypothetical protein [Methanocorpusculum sp.]HJJ63333.1 hypothetical protein [Methanocorpusculum sp.]HJJ68658.1 hypothetical protein [Methanocorpusculum sp.]